MHKKWVTALLICMLICSLVITSCTTKPESIQKPSTLLKASWVDISKQARGTTVSIAMWGGSESINRYMDEWVAPRLKQETGVTLKRVPVTDSKDIIHKLSNEKQVGKQRGSIDIIWINGENFKASKDQGLLWGSFAHHLPNVKQYVNTKSPDIQLDFGEETDNLEAPWGKAQFVFVYDQKKVKNPPRSLAELKTWIKQNPGKFTYPAPPDFTGSAFIRQALYETANGYQHVFAANKKELDKQSTKLWSFLNEIKPFLWRKGETYPESLAKLDQLYANSEVWMTMSYDPARASNEIKKGTFPASSRTFVFDRGTLSNTHYLSIPFNAKNPASAMVAINFLLSPKAQLAKYNPAHWGEDTSLDLKKLSPADVQQFKAIDRGIATLSSEELANHRVPEIPAAKVEQLEKGWQEHVAKK